MPRSGEPRIHEGLKPFAMEPAAVWDAHVIEYYAVGTAITQSGENPEAIPSPTFTISLNDAARQKVVRSAPSPMKTAGTADAAAMAAG